MRLIYEKTLQGVTISSALSRIKAKKSESVTVEKLGHVTDTCKLKVFMKIPLNTPLRPSVIISMREADDDVLFTAQQQKGIAWWVYLLVTQGMSWAMFIFMSFLIDAVYFHKFSVIWLFMIVWNLFHIILAVESLWEKRMLRQFMEDIFS